MEFKAQNITKDILLNCMYIVVAVYSRDTKNVVATTWTTTATCCHISPSKKSIQQQKVNKKSTKSQQKANKKSTKVLTYKFVLSALLINFYNATSRNF